MILEAMNNQYLIAEHYYDLTEYIDKNIYKFRRNGKYLQEGFGTVALWIAGIALAAGIGWWVYKKFFDKNNDQNKKEEAAQQKFINDSKETSEGANTLNQEIPNQNYQSMESFFTAPEFDKYIQECQESLDKIQDDPNKKRKMLEIYAKNYATQYPYLNEDEIQKILGVDRVDSQQDEAAFKFKSGSNELTLRGVCGAFCAIPGFIGSKLIGCVKSIASWGINLFKDLTQGKFWKNENYRNSIKLALYYLNFFLAIQIILEEDQSNP